MAVVIAQVSSDTAFATFLFQRSTVAVSMPTGNNSIAFPFWEKTVNAILPHHHSAFNPHARS